MFWHKHSWRVQGVNHLEWVRTDRLTGQSMHAGPCTEVLLVCDCFEFRTITLDGHWSLEQLRPKAGPVTDGDFLKGLGVKP